MYFNYDFDWFDLVHNLDIMDREITLLVIDLTYFGDN